MKKRMKGLLMGTACMLVLAGCGSSGGTENIAEGSAEEYVQAAHEILEEADSFAADFRAEVQMLGAGRTVTEGAVTMVKAPLYMNVDTTLAFDDLVQEYDMYLEETEDAVNQYMSYDGEWTEMTMTKEDALTSVQLYHTLYNMETILSAAENWTAEKDGGEVVLTGVIPEAKFYDVEEYTRWFQLAGMSGLSEVYYAGVGDVPVTVVLDEKTGEPVSYSAELTKALETVTNNVLKELNGGASGGELKVTAYQITSELTQLGGVEAEEIPAEAKSDAINYEKEYSSMDE